MGVFGTEQEHGYNSNSGRLVPVQCSAGGMSRAARPCTSRSTWATLDAILASAQMILTWPRWMQRQLT